jgi:hypothetical protein
LELWIEQGKELLELQAEQEALGNGRKNGFGVRKLAELTGLNRGSVDYYLKLASDPRLTKVSTAVDTFNQKQLVELTKLDDEHFEKSVEVGKIVKPKKKEVIQETEVTEAEIVEVEEEEEEEETIKEKMMKLVAESFEDFKEIARELGYVKKEESTEDCEVDGMTAQEWKDAFLEVEKDLGYAVRNKGKLPTTPPLECKTLAVVEEMTGVVHDATLKDLEKAKKLAGNASKLAKAIGVGTSTPSGWGVDLKKGKALTKSASKKILNYLKENR